MPFTVALSILGYVIWKVVVWRNAGPLELMEQRLKLRDDEIADYKRKLGGASPDQAKGRLEALEATVRALAPQRITAEVRQKMVPILRAQQGSLIEVTHDVTASGMKPLFDDLVGVLKQAGWRVDEAIAMAVGQPSPAGIKILVPGPGARTPPQIAIINALGHAGLDFDLSKEKPPPTLNNRPSPDVAMFIMNPITDSL